MVRLFCDVGHSAIQSDIRLAIIKAPPADNGQEHALLPENASILFALV